jgi:hypothetical protein
MLTSRQWVSAPRSQNRERLTNVSITVCRLCADSLFIGTFRGLDTKAGLDRVGQNGMEKLSCMSLDKLDLWHT